MLKLRFNIQAIARGYVLAATLGGGLGAVWIIALDQTLDLQWGTQPVSAQWLPGLLFKCAAIVAVLAMAPVLIRQPRGAKITWDSWGITEWDGAGVRTAIALARAKVGTLVTTFKTRKYDPSPGMKIGHFATIGDDDGRRIFVTEGVQLAWLNDRLSTVDDLAPLRPILEAVPKMKAELGRSSENKLVGLWTIAIVGYVGLALGYLIYSNPRATQDPAPLLVEAGAALLFLRALAPLKRWLDLRAAAGAVRRAQRVMLMGNEGTQVNAVTPDDRPLKFDVGPLKHPDGAIETRRGEAFVVLEGGTVKALETAGMRQARTDRSRAVLLELVLRASLVPLALAPVVLPAVLKGVAPDQPFELVSWSYSASGLAFSPAGDRALRITGKIEVLDTSTGAVTANVDMGLNNVADHVAVETGGAAAFIVMSGGTFRLDLSKKYLEEAVQPPALTPHSVYALTLSPDGTQVLTGMYDGSVMISGRPSPLHTLTNGRPVIAVDWSSDGRVVAAACSPPDSHYLRWWDAASGRALGSKVLKGEYPVKIALSADGSLLAYAAKQVFAIIRTSDGSEVARIEEDEDPMALEFLADGRLAVSTSGQSVGLWDLEKKKYSARWNLRSMKEFRSSERSRPPWVTRFAVGPDGSLLGMAFNGALVRFRLRP